VGHILYWIDLDLIQYVAERKPSWTIVLIGPQGPLAKHHRLHRLANVHFLGKRPMEEIPALLQGLDCCLNPYVTGHLSDAASPLKLYEYVAAGKPVVSTMMSEARKFQPWVRCANTYDEFVALCEQVIASLPEPPEVILKRSLAAAEHSWESRFKRLNELIEMYEAEGCPQKVD
jgi:glycosyltransferase involved in cell wall biosynthesis